MPTRRTLLTGVAAMAAAWALPEWEPRRRVWALGWDPAPVAIMYDKRTMLWDATWTHRFADARSLPIPEVQRWLAPHEMQQIVEMSRLVTGDFIGVPPVTRVVLHKAVHAKYLNRREKGALGL